MSWWNKIIQWFVNTNERQTLINKFNLSSKEAFISDVVPVLFRAESSKGNSAYKHQFSSWIYHGFRIRVLTGRELSIDEIIQLGAVIRSNTQLCRELVSLGYDTLEITNISGVVVKQWQLTTLIAIGSINYY